MTAEAEHNDSTPQVTHRVYFRQLLAGRDVAANDRIARQMVNFVYLIGDRETGEAVAVDPAYAPGGSSISSRPTACGSWARSPPTTTPITSAGTFCGSSPSRALRNCSSGCRSRSTSSGPRAPGWCARAGVGAGDRRGARCRRRHRGGRYLDPAAAHAGAYAREPVFPCGRAPRRRRHLVPERLWPHRSARERPRGHVRQPRAPARTPAGRHRRVPGAPLLGGPLRQPRRDQALEPGAGASQRRGVAPHLRELIGWRWFRSPQPARAGPLAFRVRFGPGVLRAQSDRTRPHESPEGHSSAGRALTTARSRGPFESAGPTGHPRDTVRPASALTRGPHPPARRPRPSSRCAWCRRHQGFEGPPAGLCRLAALPPSSSSARSSRARRGPTAVRDRRTASAARDGVRSHRLPAPRVLPAKQDRREGACRRN